MTRPILIRCSLLLLLLPALTVRPAAAQSEERALTTRTGPRFGVSFATGRNADILEHDWDARSAMLQIGWEIEAEFGAGASRVSGVSSLLPLIGGFDHGRLLPSLTWLVGIKTAKGTRICFGPDLSLTGAGLAVALSTARTSSSLAVPGTVCVVFGENGVRLNLLTGFTTGR
jgi:hypothetical protein